MGMKKLTLRGIRSIGNVSGAINEIVLLSSYYSGEFLSLELKEPYQLNRRFLNLYLAAG